MLSVWAFFAVLGAEVGPLGQIVALEGFTGLVTTLPMTVMVDVKGSASWLILGSFMPTQTAFIPVGAALLTWVKPAALEKAAGTMILCFIVTQTKLGAKVVAGLSAATEWIRAVGGGGGARRYNAVAGDEGKGDVKGKGKGSGGGGSSVVEVSSAATSDATKDVELASMPAEASPSRRDGEEGGGVRRIHGDGDGEEGGDVQAGVVVAAGEKGAGATKGSASTAGDLDTVEFAAEEGFDDDDDGEDEFIQEGAVSGSGSGWFERTHRWLMQRGPGRGMFSWTGTRLGFIAAWVIGGDRG